MNKKRHKNPYGLGPDRSPPSPGDHWLRELEEAAEHVKGLGAGKKLSSDWIKLVRPQIFEIMVELLRERGLKLREYGDDFLNVPIDVQKPV